MLGPIGAWFAALSTAGKVGVGGGALIIGSLATSPLLPCNEPIVYKEEQTTTSIAYRKNVSFDQNAGIDEVVTTKPGVNGSANITNKVGTKCGKEVSRKETKSVVTKEPVAAEEVQGLLDVSEEDVTEAIVFGNQRRPNPDMLKGQEKIVQVGINGKKTVTYKVYKKDGTEIRRSVTNSVVTEDPIVQITEYGTKEATPPPNCDPNYSPCIPYVSYDLDCGDIGVRVYVKEYDHHDFDADGDRVGCESY